MSSFDFVYWIGLFLFFAFIGANLAKSNGHSNNFAIGVIGSGLAVGALLTLSALLNTS